MSTQQQAIQDATRLQYQALHDSISKARESCIDDQRANLRHKAEQVQAILTALDQADLQSRTADFEAVAKQVAVVNADMQVLKAEIVKVVQDIAVAAKVVSAIDSAASAAGKMFT